MRIPLHSALPAGLSALLWEAHRQTQLEEFSSSSPVLLTVLHVRLERKDSIQSVPLLSS